MTTAEVLSHLVQRSSLVKSLETFHLTSRQKEGISVNTSRSGDLIRIMSRVGATTAEFELDVGIVQQYGPIGNLNKDAYFSLLTQVLVALSTKRGSVDLGYLESLRGKLTSAQYLQMLIWLASIGSVPYSTWEETERVFLNLRKPLLRNIWKLSPGGSTEKAAAFAGLIPDRKEALSRVTRILSETWLSAADTHPQIQITSSGNVLWILRATESKAVHYRLLILDATMKIT